MTRIDAVCAGETLTLRAEGHATGSPEVCSGVSTLLYALANWICSTAREKEWSAAACRAEIKKGSAFLMMPGTYDAEIVFDAIVGGLALLETADPAALHVRYVRDEASDVAAPGAIDLRAFDAGEADAAAEAPHEDARGIAASPLPAAEKGEAQFPQPRRWRPIAEQGRERQTRQGGPKAPAERVRGFEPEDDNPSVTASPCQLPLHKGAYPDPADDASPAPDPAALAAARHARASAFAEARCGAWLAEAEALRGRCPDFDLEAMARDRVFTLLLAGGVPMERAYRAADSDAIALRAAAEARRGLAEHIRANGARPVEAGCASQPAFAVRDDPARLSDGQVRDVLARLDRREHVSFG